MKKKGYSEVLKDLEAIVEKMNRGEISIDQLGANVKSAAEMIRFLRKNLSATETEITAILKDLDDVPQPTREDE